jgi:hypothetical protein
MINLDMRRKAAAVGCLTAALLFAPQKNLRADPSSGLALGVYGLGNMYDAGSPRITWVLSPTNSLEFSPKASASNFPAQNSRFYDTQLSLRIAARHTVWSAGGLHLNALAELGVEHDDAHSGPYKTYTMGADVGLGPDIEYFVRSMPGLSVGARILLRYGGSSTKEYGPGGYYSSQAYKQLTLGGEALAIRYYFEGSNDRERSWSAAASSEYPGKLALGVHGAGSMFNNGSPRATWMINPRNAVDLTPIFLGRATREINTIRNSDTLGLNIAWIRTLSEWGGLRLGVAAEAGYTHSNYHDSSNYRQNQTTYQLGLGPDLEYFIPACPQLSIGARTVIRYSLYEDREINPGGPSSHGLTRTISLLGEGLSIRYYFGESSVRRPASRRLEQGF